MIKITTGYMNPSSVFKAIIGSKLDKEQGVSDCAVTTSPRLAHVRLEEFAM